MEEAEHKYGHITKEDLERVVQKIFNKPGGHNSNYLVDEVCTGFGVEPRLMYWEAVDIENQFKQFKG